LTAGALEPAVVTRLRLLALDPLRESAHRTLMDAYVRQGRRTAAVRQYQRCVEVLQRELGVAPEAATTRRFREIQSETPPEPAATVGPTTHYVRSGDVNLAYQVIGEGPPDLVLVPGWVSLRFARVGVVAQPAGDVRGLQPARVLRRLPDRGGALTSRR
jgi:hypothetical protein